ncbi:MAG: hypothetical protein A2798_00145 [Candidatus Levybacteria bacterium RIFCSPHIGHO2_01_FULL_37_17]|nr:MAG: hypothetical protein A2798_00145 [Candidatus Levybacteria bacterium RIFCSPHIGHO2_01_FULL_37_17]OGH36494.1 MAG: hypothetical protein A2959_03220 [Candidatus Levybacteria bacterium RIFCSPLOWO2_01_FULL_38_23]
MEKKVEFKVGALNLVGSLFTPKGRGPFPSVVIYHGRGSSRGRYLDLSKKLSKNGIMAFAFDFRGCGESDGILEEGTQRMGIDDARGGLEFLLKQNVDKDRVGIFGSSFGGFVGAVIAGEYHIKSIVFRAPAVYPDETLDTYVDSIEELDFSREEWLSSIAYKGISKFKGNLLIIKNEKDEVVKPWVVKNYLTSAVHAIKKEMFVLKGASHSISEIPKLKKESDDKVVNWFLETL